MEVAGLQSYFSLCFFGFTACFLALPLLLLLLRHWPWCSCHVCRAYLNSTWTSEFDNLVDWYAHLLRSSPTGTIHIHVLGNTVTANPQNVEHMLRTRFDNFPKGRAFAAILGDLLGDGIFNADGDAWRFQRKLASLELGAASVRSLASATVSSEIRHRLLPLLARVSADESRSIDVQDVFRRFAFDTICKVSFGLDPGCLDLAMPVSEFAAAFDAATMLSARRAMTAAPAVWKLKRMLNLGSERELRRAIELVDGLAKEVIWHKRAKCTKEGHDLLERFMASVDDDKYLRDIVVSFLLAGRDTVASGLTGFFLLVAKRKDVKAAIVDEISKVLGEGGGEEEEDVASYEQLREMNYVHAAIHETLRLLPPVQFDSKFCVEDDVLPDGSFVRSGTRVTYHPYAMGRMPELWGGDCEEFRPERWLDAAGKFAPASPYKYPVFQGGLRVCLGKEMALMEMKAVVVSVLRSFDIDVVDRGGRGPKFAPGLTATIAGGLQAKIRRRGGAR